MSADDRAVIARLQASAASLRASISAAKAAGWGSILATLSESLAGIEYVIREAS